MNMIIIWLQKLTTWSVQQVFDFFEGHSHSIIYDEQMSTLLSYKLINNN